MNHYPSFPPSPCELVLSKVKEDKITHYSIIPVFQLCLPAIALAQARRAGAKRTKFSPLNHQKVPSHHLVNILSPDLTSGDTDLAVI